MNRFGRIAQERWQALAPTAYAQIPDPNHHFSTLGEQAEKAWIDLADQLSGPDVPAETYFEKVGRINNARARAQEIIEADWLTPQPETSTEVVELSPAEATYQAEQRTQRRWDQLLECLFSPEEASQGDTDLTWPEISEVLDALKRTGKPASELTDTEWAPIKALLDRIA